MNSKKLIITSLIISFLTVGALLFIAVPSALACGESAYGPYGPYQPEPTGLAGLDSLFLVSAGLYTTGTGMVMSASTLINRLDLRN